MADNHESSALDRAQVRALVALETKLGVPSKYAKLVLYGLILLVLFCVTSATTSLLFDEDEDGVGGEMSFGFYSSSSSTGGLGMIEDDEEEEDAAPPKRAASAAAEDDDEEGDSAGGGDDDDGESSSSGDAGDDDEEEGGSSSNSASSSFALSEDTSEKFKAAQLKKFQDKDKTLMKFFQKYRKDTEITMHFKELIDMYGELGLIKQVPLGKTYEHKQIYSYELGKGTRSILLLAGERGNEWAGSMALTYFATRLLQKYALTPQVSAIMNDLTLLIVPVGNPDGYAYHKSDWYMNRAPDAQTGKKKQGVDVSKDFQQFSQMETLAIQKYALQHQSNLYAFANVKCCQGSVSLPKQAICPKTEEEQMGLATRISQAMGKGGKFKYPIRTNTEDLDDSPSFAFRDLGLGLSFSLDVKQDKPTDDILVTSQNVTMGLLELSKFILNDFPATKNMFGGGGAQPCTNNKLRSKRETAAAADAKVADEDEEDHGQAFAQAKPSKREERGDVDDFTDRDIEISIANANRKARLNVQVPEANPENSFLYFAYGPDMLYDVLLKAGLTSAWKVSNAKLAGYVFDYTYHSTIKWKSGVADMVKSAHSTSAVYGVVWRLSLEQMPLLLAWQSASTETSPLAQKQVSVESASGEVFSCITFYVRKKMRGEDVLDKYHRFNPSRQYRNCVLKGAKSNRLPLEYIDHTLKKRSLGPLFTDKVGTMNHRNPTIGTVCDPLTDL